ncbi:alcohol oxidase [Moniliophthora roreri MCA 2997]|uniref:Alcohol oxidase n=1 Tax=Moniliophthora roreri (strain MCA 2997) TaxID=1381753 RepID=V2WB91_MONRO|nr:alcohol oxidase [Moniliophthora roreri MCA 2997]
MGHPNEVDVIVAGGGPAGCVVAGRLAYADPNLKVMLIEGGANNRDDPWVYRPGIYVKNMQRDGINDKATFYVDTMKSSYLRGRQSIVPCANILGGGSSINFQMYTRASASDWDDFKTPGWTAKELLPLMKRLENYQKPVNNDTHGYDGPIAISNGGSITALAQDFLRAADAIGVPFSDDIQDLDTAHASEIWAKYINRHTGRRSDAATAYVHSVMDIQSNLYLRTNARVSRVIFEGNKAVGVAYVPSRNRAHKGQLLETIVKARKYVVLSGGTLGTPQILERSGVGDSKLLQKLDIKVVSDLPGVGEEYQDHYTTLSIYRVSNESFTTDDFLRGDKEAQKELFTEWETSPEKARLSSNAIDAGFKIRPTEEELKEMGPDFNALWDRYFKDKPDKPVMFGSIVSGAYADHALLPPGKYMTMFQYLEYPASRGKIHINSPSPYVEPFFDSGFMNHKADFAPIRWSYKKTREVARRMDAFRGELTSHHPHFHPASPAACRDIDIKTAKQIYPDGLTVGIHMGTWHRPSEPYDADKVHDDIKYTEEDDKAIDDWIADHVETTWHSLGTCAMKPREEGGVVDGRLNVFGTQNLKVCDLSICPDNLGTNTYSSALLVGEKGADLLAEDLGLKIKTPHAPVPHTPVPSGKPATQLVR